MIAGVYCMIGLEISDSIVLEQKQVLEQALSTNPKTQKALQKLIREVIQQARRETVNSITFKNGDPRGAARAVRTAVYKKILGANINIYNSKKAHGSVNYSPPRTLQPLKRGGNRREVSSETRRYQSYGPLDRGFVLRFVNSDTKSRNIHYNANESRKVDKWNKHPNTGNRGSIAAHNFFRNAGEPALFRAVNALSELIDAELENMLNKTK